LTIFEIAFALNDVLPKLLTKLIYLNETSMQNFYTKENGFSPHELANNDYQDVPCDLIKTIKK
jgi:hypothetical protein